MFSSMVTPGNVPLATFGKALWQVKRCGRGRPAWTSHQRLSSSLAFFICKIGNNTRYQVFTVRKGDNGCEGGGVFINVISFPLPRPLNPMFDEPVLIPEIAIHPPKEEVAINWNEKLVRIDDDT